MTPTDVRAVLDWPILCAPSLRVIWSETRWCGQWIGDQSLAAPHWPMREGHLIASIQMGAQDVQVVTALPAVLRQQVRGQPCHLLGEVYHGAWYAYATVMEYRP